MAPVNLPEAQPLRETEVAGSAESGGSALAAPERGGLRLLAAARAVGARLHPLHGALVAVLALATVLDFHRLAQNGYANIFYSAAVKSELHSWHNFLFLSSDPGGFIAVDKTPVGVWLQVASAKVFGFSAMSLLVPEAVVGVLAVALMYGIVARRLGRVAGVLAALALAVFPSFVAVARDNGPDPLLVAFMLIACGAALRATETGRLRWLLASAVAVGLAFDTKTLAALLVVPGVAAAYLVCAPAGVWRRLWHLAVAGVVLVVVSGAWIAYVDLTPAGQRPYVGGSTNNTEVNLTFQYNGVGRVGGQSGGPGRVPHLGRPRPKGAGAFNPRPAIPRVGHARHPTAFGPAPGVLRLFGVGLGDQGAWYLPFAAIGLVAAALAFLLAPRRRDPRLAFLIVLGGWFGVEAVLLSFSKGIVHPYYMSALAPGAAAMVGAGAVAMAGLVRERRWLVVLPALAAGSTLLVQSVLLRREHWHTGWPVWLGAAAAAAIAAAAVRRSWSLPACAAVVGALLVVPGVYSATTWDVPVEGTFPAAGPHVAEGHGGIGVGSYNEGVNRALLAYVRANGADGPRAEVFTLSSDVAAPLILLGGRAAAIGGYSGTDPALDGPGLGRLVAAGRARYLWLGGAYADRGGNRATRAAEHLCRHVPASEWLGAGRNTLPLFDCAGRAVALETVGARCPAACLQTRVGSGGAVTAPVAAGAPVAPRAPAAAGAPIAPRAPVAAGRLRGRRAAALAVGGVVAGAGVRRLRARAVGRRRSRAGVGAINAPATRP